MALPPLKSASGFVPHPPLPSGLAWQVHYTRTEGHFPSTTGRGQLWYGAFWPTSPHPRGILVFIHGVGEHSERYHHVLAQFAARGFVAAAHDLLGHGRSEGARADIERLEEYMLDAEKFVSILRGEVGSKVPVFVWGQSMGGLLASHLALRDSMRGQADSVLAGAIVTSGAIEVERNFILSLQEKLAPILARLLPTARIVAAVRPEDMSSDPAEVERYVKDPLNTIGNLRVRLALQVAGGMNELMEHAGELRTPLLVLHGTEDRCTHMPGAEKLVQLAGAEDKQFVPFQGMYHTMLHEPQQQEVADAMLAFVERLSGGGGGGEHPRSKL